MRKNLKRMALLLLIAVVLIPMAIMTALASGNENLALGKPATASSSYPGKPWTPDKAVDGEEFQTVKECTATEAGAQSYRDLGVEEAQYIRINCLEPKTAKYGYSIYEVEVFAQNKMESAQDVLDALKGQAPTLSEDGTSLVLPEVPAGYETALYGSDNRQVVKQDGTIIQPLVDMKVNLLYKVTSTTDPEDVATSDADIAITIPGQYTQNAEDNAVPNVMPGLREWKDGTDSTANGYDATLHGMTVANGVAQFTAEDYLSMPFDSIGYPYTVSVRVNLSQVDETTALFSGEDGTLYANIDNTGKVGIKRGAYRFSFDYELPLNEWVTLTFVGDASHTTLYANGVSKGTAKLMDPTIGGKPQYSDTSIMTFEKVMVNATGSMDELLIYNYAMTAEEIQDALNLARRDNLALNKDVTVSGLEVNDGRFTADKAVDGIVSKDSCVSFAKNQDEQWMVVDLGQVYNISELVIQYESQVPKYKIEVSTDGETYTQVYSFSDDSLAQGGASGVHTITLDQPVDARYVKYTQLQRWKHTGNGNYYSGSIYEFEVYQATNAELKAYTQAALDTFAQYQPGTHNGNVDETFYTSAVETLEDYLALANGDAAVDKLSAAMDGLTAGGAPETTDKPEATDQPQNTDKPEATEKPENNVPQTGDTQVMGLWLVLCMGALSCLSVMALRQRRR